MCDTFVILANSTQDGSVILGKNSDREPNEAHEIKIIPAADHALNSQVNCTYIAIPQVAHTYAVLLAKPFWIWGAEMGLNEHGVAIGNEAVFTRVPYEKAQGLIGMDLIRLGLERAKTALEALRVITSLLETHGQAGNCGFTHPFYYHNSFILADPREAWVLETAGRQWVAEKVKDVRSISNAPTIGSDWDMASSDLVKYAVDRGWCKGRDDFHFARCYSDFLYTTLSDARSRQACTTRLLQEERGKIEVRQAMHILRSHGEASEELLPVDRSLLGATVCMHAGAGPVRNSQSVGSMVAHLTSQQVTAWVTGTSAPCTGIFKPVWLDAGLPYDEPPLTGTFDPRCLFWRHERLHRSVLADYTSRLQVYAADRDRLEARFLQRAAACDSNVEARKSFSAQCFQLADQAEEGWLARVKEVKPARATRFYYTAAWKGFNRQAAMPDPSAG
jgi:dipeptidase